MIVAGFGFRAGASDESLRDALARAAKDHVPQVLATAHDKVDGLRTIATALNLPVAAVNETDLARQATLTQSETVNATRNTGSVAEAAALTVAGSGAQLVARRHISQDRMATCAIAIGDQT
jgi:cobalt-precorrin 5A hydrolase